MSSDDILYDPIHDIRMTLHGVGMKNVEIKHIDDHFYVYAHREDDDITKVHPWVSWTQYPNIEGLVRSVKEWAADPDAYWKIQDGSVTKAGNAYVGP